MHQGREGARGGNHHSPTTCCKPLKKKKHYNALVRLLIQMEARRPMTAKAAEDGPEKHMAEDRGEPVSGREW